MGFPSFLGAFFLVSHLLVLHSYSSCPSSFNCGKLAPLKFPFTKNTQPLCGWFNVSCDERPRVKFGAEGRSYQITDFSDDTISLKDPLLETQIESNDCDFSGYINPLKWHMHKHSISITILPNITFFKCVTHTGNTELEMETKKRFPHNNYIHYKGCHGDTVYYLCPNQSGNQVPSLPTLGSIPENCAFFQLPMVSSVKGRDLSDPFSLLTPNFSIKYNLSAECRECLDDGSLCRHDSGEFQCKRRGRKRLPLILGTGTIVGVLG